MMITRFSIRHVKFWLIYKNKFLTEHMYRTWIFRDKSLHIHKVLVWLMQCRVYINQNLFAFTLFEQKLKVSLKTKLFHIQNLQNSYDTLKIMLYIYRIRMRLCQNFCPIVSSSKMYDWEVYWLLSNAFGTMDELKWWCLYLHSETVFVYIGLQTFWQDWISGIRGSRTNLTL